jgi:hypothetical protein
MRVRCFDLDGIDAANRRSALRAQLLAWSPFDDCEYRAVIQRDCAVAVAWDRGVVRALLAQASAPDDAVIEPELWLREPMSGDGLRVIDALEGVDVQWWRGGALAASRWWPRRPREPEATEWLRTLGVGSDGVTSLPIDSNPAWLSKRSVEPIDLDGLASSTTRIERITVGVVALVLVGFSAAQVHQLHDSRQRTIAMQSELDRLQQEAAPAIAARDVALGLAREATAVATQLSAVSSLEVLQHLAEVTSGGGVLLKELDLTGTKLRLSLEVPTQVARGNVVRDLQAGGWFTGVTEVNDSGNRGWTVFDVELSGLRPPAQGVAATPNAGSTVAAAAR